MQLLAGVASYFAVVVGLFYSVLILRCATSEVLSIVVRTVVLYNTLSINRPPVVVLLSALVKPL